MTGPRMVQRVRDYIDEQSETNFSTQFLIDSLNAGQDVVHSIIVSLEAGYFEKPAEINPNGNPKGTTPGVDRYLLPEDFHSFRRVEYKATNEPLLPIDLNDKQTSGMGLVDRLMGSSTGHGYYASGKDMVIDPVPTTAFEVRMTYVYLLPEITTANLSSYVSEIPRSFHDMVCIAGAIDAKIKDEADTAALERKFAREKVRLETTLGSRQSQLPKMVGGSRNYN